MVLVHGWNSYPGVWSKLVARLEEKSIPAWNFDHSTLRGASVTDIAISLQIYIREMRKKTGWDKNIDLVCHSMGTFAARYFVEVVDGKNRGEKVRQVIGIGPPNNGSALAELFNSPINGPEILESLAGQFVSRSFNPSGDTIVQECRPGSRRELARRHPEDGRRGRRHYAKTWEMSADGTWKTTYDGDGIITRAEANLPGAGMDIVPVDAASLELRPYDYCHIRLPRNAEVIDRIVEYLIDPETQPQGFCE